MDETKKTLDSFPTPPEAWLPARRIARRISEPVERFLHTETSGGILLLVSAALALLWANSPWSHSYEHLWHTPITIGLGEWSLTRDLHFWISDFLMTFFFLVAGLEIKREMVQGELSDLRRASLPIAAAAGGMIVPALIYVGFNRSGAALHGWGIPMATDIAFAVGILQLLGPRVPAALRVLLLALAIIDDVGAILVIAIFYSSDLSMTGFAIAAGGFLLLILAQQIGARPGLIYMIPLLVMWGGLFKAGIHPTISGVIVGLMFPVRPWLSASKFEEIASGSLAEFQRLTAGGAVPDGHAAMRPLRRITVAGREAIAPVARMEYELHPWVAYLIMPVFAFANAGVPLGGVDFADITARMVLMGSSLGLVLGKPIGVLLASYLMVRAGLCRLPRGVTWTGMTVVGFVAGIGFTMSIFIARLAFPGSPEMLDVAKLGVLLGTAVAAIGGLAMGRFLMPERLAPDVAAVTPSEAESSSEY